jgi:putative ABC transporter permease protein yesP
MSTTAVKRKSPAKRRRAASLDKRKAKSGWIFVLPFVIGFVVIYLPIIVNSIIYSFSEFETIAAVDGGGFILHNVGFANYQKALFEDTEFVQILISGLKQLLFDVPAIVIFSLFLAVILNEKMVGRAAFRAILFVPVILQTGLIAEIDSTNTLLESMNDTSSGISTGASGGNAVSEIVSATDISWLFSSMKVGTELVEYVTQMINNIYDIINRSGVQMLIFLAGLQSISPAIYESCDIDGATQWETFWKITVPMISPMILVNAVYTVIDAFTSSSNKVMTYISGIYSQAGGNVLSAAMSWMYFLLVIACIGLVVAVLSAFVFYQRRD